MAEPADADKDVARSVSPLRSAIKRSHTEAPAFARAEEEQSSKRKDRRARISGEHESSRDDSISCGVPPRAAPLCRADTVNMASHTSLRPRAPALNRANTVNTMTRLSDERPVHASFSTRKITGSYAATGRLKRQDSSGSEQSSFQRQVSCAEQSSFLQRSFTFKREGTNASGETSFKSSFLNAARRVRPPRHRQSRTVTQYHLASDISSIASAYSQATHISSIASV
jgi:hypothetical protein